MADPTVVRIYSFRTLGSEAAFDDGVRSLLLPGLVATPGISDAFVGRSADDHGRRLIATIWDSLEAAEAVDIEAMVGHLVDDGSGIVDAHTEIADVRIAFRAERLTDPTILRIFRGETRAGELGSYLIQTRAGLTEEARTNDGLVAVYLGETDAARFLTVSAWTTWEAIEQATGGDIRHPLATRHPERVVAAEVTHYEILPFAARPIPRGTALASAS
jgi:heme-degrading monooxygenase HmoA